MGSKVVNTYVNSVDLLSPYHTLRITATGTVGTYGVTTGTAAAYTIVNDGLIHAKAMGPGGAARDGFNAIDLNAGGLVINGSATDTTATITGLIAVNVSKQPGTISNFGKMFGLGRYGIDLAAGGTITNGSTADTSAYIRSFPVRHRQPGRQHNRCQLRCDIFGVV